MPRRTRLIYSLAFAASLVGLTSVMTDEAEAQSLPGLIVSVPPDSSTPAPQGPSQRQPRVPAIASTQPTAPPRAAPPKQRRSAPARKPRQVAPARPAKASTSIVVLVNAVPITEYEVTQRARLMALSANLREDAAARFKSMIKRESTNQRLRAILEETVAANRGKSRDEILAIFERRKKAFAMSLQKQAVDGARSRIVAGLRKKALDELVDERLKVTEATRLKIAPSKRQLDQAIAQIAKRNKTDTKGFSQRIRGLGVDFNTMRDRIRAQIAWNNVVQARFSRLISINQRDIDRELAGQQGQGDSVSIRLHRVTLTLPQNVTQASIAKRIAEAEELQRRFTNCGSTKALAARVSGARFEDLGTLKAESVEEPTRTLLLNAKDGEMVPPTTTARGVEVYAVCGRTAATGSLKAQDEARASLRRKEFDVLARRHLMDLKRDAHIEYR